MYGLLLRALQGYVTATFGAARWSQIIDQTSHKFAGFEPLLPYDIALFREILTKSCRVLGRDLAAVLEDVGTFVVTNPALPAPRRLLRFSGSDYGEFLLSLEELPERARLALFDIELPRIVVNNLGFGEYLLYCRPCLPEIIHILHGLLRAMADDYGALVFIEVDQRKVSAEEAQPQLVLLIRMAELAHAPASQFQLVAPL